MTRTIAIGRILPPSKLSWTRLPMCRRQRGSMHVKRHQGCKGRGLRLTRPVVRSPEPELALSGYDRRISRTVRWPPVRTMR